MEDYLAVARRVFEGTRYKASDEDVRKLAENMAFLEKRGLGKLNKRLIDARKHTKIFETIAEHNFAVILLTQQTSSNPISYEPSIGLQRPIDFKVEIGDITYWMQMKDLNRLKRENRQAKTIEKIKKATSDTKIAKFFSCFLSDDFEEICLPTLIDFIKDKAATAAEDDSFLFTGSFNQKAKVAFWFPNNIELSELTLGYAGDLDSLEITGLAKDQIKESLNNAAGAFTWKVDPQNINLIVMEADNKEDIDICDAVFGTEYELFVADRHSWCRKNDGLFQEYDYSAKVTGVIVVSFRQACARKIFGHGR